MKKILLATTMLVAGAGIAAADVTLSGSGRFGLKYDGNNTGTTEKTTISHRLTFNIDAAQETDSGVTFGGRIRFRNNDGESNTTGSQAKLFAEYAGFRVEVGNTEGALDAAGLLWNSEIGFSNVSKGNPRSSFFAFNSQDNGNDDYEGVFASYSVGDFTGRVSYIQADQYDSAPTLTAEDEVAVSVDYASGPFAVSAGFAQDAEGVKNADVYFLGAAYTVNDQATVGLNYIGESGDKNALTDKVGERTITLYGSYTFGATTLRAYVANNDAYLNKSDTVYGLGADYDLGGATLAGAIHRDYNKETLADLGVKFSF